MDSKLTSQNRWETMESITGTYAQNQVQNDQVELRFTRPVPVQEHCRYAIRLCSQGAKTCFGDSGVSSLRGPCGATFSFYPCDLSFNGTNTSRGQLPCLLYYSSPRRSDLQNGKVIGEIHARDIALQIAREITDQSMEILKLVRDIIECGYYSDKSLSSVNVHCVDSEHNITPIEEHLDVSCSHRTEFIGESSSMSLATRELTKKFESFTKGLVETLKSKTNPFECEIATDVVQENAPKELNRNEPYFGEYMNYYRQHPEEVDNEGQDEDEDNDNEEVGDSSRVNASELLDIFNNENSALYHTLLPAVIALVGPLVNSDPKSTVQILSIIRQVLPHVAALNQQMLTGCITTTPLSDPNDQFGEDDVLNENQPEQLENHNMPRTNTESTPKHLGLTTSNHYCTVESEHPYKSASILTCRVEFPPCVQWFTIEFDPQCGTVQPDDYLNVSIPVQCLDKPTTQRWPVKCESQGNRQVDSISSWCSMVDDNVGFVVNSGRDDTQEDWIVVKKLNR